MKYLGMEHRVYLFEECGNYHGVVKSDSVGLNEAVEAAFAYFDELARSHPEEPEEEGCYMDDYAQRGLSRDDFY